MNVGAKKHEFEELSGAILGAALAVHRELGSGFLESVYESALQVALRHRSITYASQYSVDIVFEGCLVGRAKIDLIVGGSIVVEIKAVALLAEAHHAQLRSYLAATGLQIGLLLNFNAPVLAIKRIVA
jgi:GxxExxY protein